MSIPMVRAQHRSVLISGASIAGLTLAFWLDHYGFDVTVVERASTIRTGGYPIDVRGTATDVVERMGLLSQIQEAHIASRDVTFVDGAGHVLGNIPIYEAIGNKQRDVELPRGTLTTLLYEATRGGRVNYRFDDSITSLHDVGKGVDIGFTNGEVARYDVIIGADGLHSHTRNLVFGPEELFRHSLGFCFNLFSIPNDGEVSHGAVIHAEPGRTAGVWAIQDNPSAFGFLAFAIDEVEKKFCRDAKEQMKRTRAVFSGMGWKVPHLLNVMEASDDLYFDTVSQIRMPRWSAGRVALVGDAACAPSFRSGQGTSLALVGAYVLAGELAVCDTPEEAFAAYEHLVRPFSEANQTLATDDNGAFFLPKTQRDIEVRNHILSEIARNGTEGIFDARRARVYNFLHLPDYRTM
ncbi:FAD-dependent monooxygenase [Gluconobacter sphaericus]|uniref:FAD-dependent monooxygenase n=1 Tax=Gluconobacter sphaericus TaxID=574987 RepID=UPI001922C88C|nr:FAD-dependent monooxygenase [Gluconobacter sphaericus]QQX91598.1 FAD-dependent monooxygenase [Gluconobacter sphaericus]